MNNMIKHFTDNTLISFNRKNYIFTIKLLCDNGSGFILDLADESDKEEFNSLLNFFIKKEGIIELENPSSMLELKWEDGKVLFNHYFTEKVNPFNTAVDILDEDNISSFTHTLAFINMLYTVHKDNMMLQQKG